MSNINNDSLEFTKGIGTILLVEDEELVREVTKEMLECGGYHVIEARNGNEALRLCSQTEMRIDLVLTDVVMPEMGGRELAESLVRIRPALSILFTSGYTDDFVTRDYFLDSNVNFIQKPFSLGQLISKIQAALNTADKGEDF